MGQQAPPLLKWYICQMCRPSLPHRACSVEDAVISMHDLEKLAGIVMASVSNSTRVSEVCSSFFSSPQARLFATPATNGSEASGVSDFAVNVVPVLLGHLGMDVSVEIWEDILTSLQQRLDGRGRRSVLHTGESTKSSDSCAALSSRSGHSGPSDTSGLLELDTHSESCSFRLPFDDEVASLVGTESLCGVDDWDVSGGSQGAGSGGLVRSSSFNSDSQQPAVADILVPWFDRLSREELVAKIHERDTQLTEIRRQLDLCRVGGYGRAVSGGTDALRGNLKRKNKECKQLRRINDKQADKIQRLEQKLDALKSMLIERRGSRLKPGNSDHPICDRGWLTANGIIHLAIKRNLAHCASEHLQLLIQQDVSRWTVSRGLDALV